MIKMPCLFGRTFEGRHQSTISEVVTPGCEWVTAGEGVATRKYDGTACDRPEQTEFRSACRALIESAAKLVK